MTIVDDHETDDLRDQFPVGMRVLAVDDDPTCLMVLETLLRRCQYHVTTTKNAIAALKMLRENRNKFDLVISDVHMPDMDGFKLLELVGLEMDLPVIMLSVNDDPKLVMKGITHGACDYLLKPVRIEELQNIWQHVIRRKKIDSKEWNKTSNQDKSNADSYNGRGSAATGNLDQNGKSFKRRKNQDEDEEEYENGHDNEDSSNQKKARVVWSVELHRKFVTAVNQLGIEKAVPKKILDLMNDEKLTRENVASHLQKYRLYLKRISCGTNHQANMVAALSCPDTPYMRICSLSGVGNLHTLSGPKQFHNNAFRSFPPGGMISRLNTPGGLNVHGFPSSGTLQMGQNSNNSINDPLKFQSAKVCGNQNIIQGMPMPVGLDQLQNNKGVSPILNLTPLNNGLVPDQRPKITMSCSPSSVLDISNNALILKENPQDTHGSGVYENSTSIASQHSQFSGDIWSNSMKSLSGTDSYPPNERFRQATMPPTDNMSSVTLQGRNLSGASFFTTLSSQSHDSLVDMHSQGVIFTNNPGQISNNVPFEGLDNQNQDGSYHPQDIGNAIDHLISLSGNIDPEGHIPIDSNFNRNLDFNFCDPLQMKHDGIMGWSEETSLKPQVYTMSQQKSLNSGISNNLGSLEDLVSAMVKQKQDNVTLLDGYLCDNNYSGGTSM